MFNIPLTENVIFVHHFSGVSLIPKRGCHKRTKVKGNIFFWNKYKYINQEEADKTIEKIKNCNRPLLSYFCPHCGHYHIGKEAKYKIIT